MEPSSETFRPAWWLPGAHAQTLGARLLRRRGGVAFRRERLDTPDGDFLDLDWPTFDGRRVPSAAPLVLVLHGLEGSARSGYVVELERRLAARGLAAVGLSFRSCSGEPNRALRFYHSGETGDLELVLGWLGRRFPGRPLATAGFSLGGNVLLKWLGERGAGAGLMVRAAAAVSVPLDLAAGARHLEHGFSRVYVRVLLRSLKRKVRHRAADLASRADVARGLAARTFWEFDDAITAPLHGFADAADYYRRSSSGRLLPGIRVPTLLVQALDDPFVPAEATTRWLGGAPPDLRAAVTAGGGHVGFAAGARPLRPRFWAEETVAGFLYSKLA